MVHYKPTEYNEIKEESKEFCHLPVKVKISSSNNLDSKVETSVHEITSTNLNEIEQVIMQDILSEIITITDEDDPQILNHDDEAVKLDQAISQDLQVIMEGDEATVNLINMIQFEDMVHAGRDEATINLVTKLETETKIEETQHNKEKDKLIKEKTTKNAKNFPPLPQSQNPKQQQSPEKPEPYHGQIMSTENNISEAHKLYLTQRAQSYKME